MTYRLYDMHCHLDRIANAEEVVAEAAERGLALFCVPVTPRESEAAAGRFASAGNVRVGAGLHPWWVGEAMPGLRSKPGIESDLRDFTSLFARSRFIGEVGLDFGRAHEATRGAQLTAFERIARACAEHPVGGRTLSIHAVHAAGAAMDALEEYGLVKHAACIFHWFSGTSEELVRARCLGCYFSVNEMMLATRKGREYARIVPEERLLLETDAPPGLDTPYSAAELEGSLGRVLDRLAAIRHRDREALAVRIAATSSALLALD